MGFGVALCDDGCHVGRGAPPDAVGKCELEAADVVAFEKALRTRMSGPSAAAESTPAPTAESAAGAADPAAAESTPAPTAESAAAIEECIRRARGHAACR